MRSPRFFLLSFLCFLGLLSCSLKQARLGEGLVLGIVPYHQPTQLYELFAGKIFPYRSFASEQDEKELTELLSHDIQKNTHYQIKILDGKFQRNPQQSPVVYWSTIGKEQGCDVLIIPQIMEWKEAITIRNEYIPPKIAIEYYLFDVVNKVVLERSRYYDAYLSTEYQLRYNTPVNGMFFNNRPSRMEIAIDSIHKMLIDFGFIRNIKEKNIFAR